MAKLLVHESAGVREFEIVDNEVHMGRELDNTLRLPDPSISRHHCVLRKVGEGYEIQDLQSSNGVLVNGNRVQSSPLRDGDRITLGQVQMTFRDLQPEVSPGTLPVSVQVPQGTVRMSAEELAAIHSGKPPVEAEAPPLSQDQIATGQVVSQAPPPAPPVAPPLPPVAPQEAPGPGPLMSAGALANPLPAFLQSYLPPVPDDAQPTGERGDFGSRLLAYLIDMVPLVALWIAIFVLQSVLGLVLGPGACLIAILIGLLHFAVGVGYVWLFLPYCWIKFGASAGKKIMKLRVMPEGNPGGRIDVGSAALRMVGHFINGLLLGLPYLMILGGERKGIHDLISKSIVIKVDR